MDTGSVLRSQVEMAHQILEGTMADVTPEQAQWLPPGNAVPLGATYAHMVMGEDMMINMMLQGKQQLRDTSHAGKLGLSEPPPGTGQPWEEWSRSVKVDLPALKQYAQAVYKNTTDYIGSLSDGDLSREIDLSNFGMGRQTVAWVFGNFVVGHLNNHCGEASCLKGLQGAKGYPF